MRKLFRPTSSFVLITMGAIVSCTRTGGIFPNPVVLDPGFTFCAHSKAGEFAVFPQSPIAWGCVQSAGDFKFQSWDLNTGQPASSVALPASTVTFAFAQELPKALIGTSEANGTITLSAFDLPSARAITSATISGRQLSQVALSPDGSVALAIISDPKSIVPDHVYLWKVTQGTPPVDLNKVNKTSLIHTVWVTSFPFSKSGMQLSVVATAQTPTIATNQSLLVFDVSKNDWVFNQSFPYKANEGRLWTAFSHGGQYVATVWKTDDQAIAYPGHYELTMWDVASGTALWKHPAERIYSSIVVRFSPNDQQIFFGTIDGGSRVLDVKTGNLIHSLNNLGVDVEVSDADWASDQRFLVGGFPFNNAALWDGQDGHLITTLGAPSQIQPDDPSATSSAHCGYHHLSPDGTYVVAEGLHGTVPFLCIYDVTMQGLVSSNSYTK